MYVPLGCSLVCTIGGSRPAHGAALYIGVIYRGAIYRGVMYRGAMYRAVI